MNLFKRTHTIVLCCLLLAASLLLGACDLNALLGTGSTKKTAILYGISIYVDYSIIPYSSNEGIGQNLKYPDDDVNSMANLLSSQGWTVIKRINGGDPADSSGGASLANLQTDISNVLSTLESGERVLFYYSGHGISNPTSSGTTAGEWIFPYGSVSSSTIDYTKALNPSNLVSLFKPLTDRKANLVIILDSCNSGGFVANGTYSSDLPDDYSSSSYLGGQSLTDKAMLFASISDYFNGSTQSGALSAANVWVLSAAGKSEFSYDDDAVAHGVFTYTLLTATDQSNGYMKADFNHDGFVTLQELYRHSKERLDAIWNIYGYDSDGLPSQFLPHLSGNPLDILIFH